MKEKRFAIVDLETTGGNPKGGKIIEVAIYIFDGEKIIDQLVSLVNPECAIPPFITSMTHISDGMVRKAPKFYELARDIIEITKDCIFVAHNVSFDYGFICSEFHRLGYHYQRDRLCTVKLSRKIFPGLPSYSLGNLCQSLNIQLENRHRAAGDALATVKLFEMILNAGGTDEDKAVQSQLRLSQAYPFAEKLADIPSVPGIYFFRDKDNNILYIGKSKDLKKRVLTHLGIGNTTPRGQKLQHLVSDVDWEETGSELLALLRESEEIKKHKPRLNRAGRRNNNFAGIFDYVDLKGYRQIFIDYLHKYPETDPVCGFENTPAARRKLEKIISQYRLCPKLCGMDTSPNACFSRQLGRCEGACEGVEPADSYNSRVEEALGNLYSDRNSFLLLEDLDYNGNVAAVFIENGILRAMGIMDESCSIASREDIENVLHPAMPVRDAELIIKSYLKKKKCQVIPL